MPPQTYPTSESGIQGVEEGEFLPPSPSTPRNRNGSPSPCIDFQPDNTTKTNNNQCTTTTTNINNDNNQPSQTSQNKINIVPYSLAPSYLKFNPWITAGYRKDVKVPKECVRSVFMWTNETLNIWTHVAGWLCFFSLMCYEIWAYIGGGREVEELIVKVGVLLCFQACTLLSSCYHTFCCTSSWSYRKWLTADLFGVSMSLLGIYLSGIYFAFKCEPFWLNFYLFTVLGIFLIALYVQLSSCADKSKISDEDAGFHWRLVLFGLWAVYGFIPTLQWVWVKGMEDPVVVLLLPRIVKMYALSGAAFFFYISKMPERAFPGKFNYVFSSHQIWHVLIFTALYFWYTVTCDHFQAEEGYNTCSLPYQDIVIQ